MGFHVLFFEKTLDASRTNEFASSRELNDFFRGFLHSTIMLSTTTRCFGDFFLFGEEAEGRGRGDERLMTTRRAPSEPAPPKVYK